MRIAKLLLLDIPQDVAKLGVKGQVLTPLQDALKCRLLRSSRADYSNDSILEVSACCYHCLALVICVFDSA